MSEELTDNDLMHRVQTTRDHHAYAMLVRRHSGRFYAAAYRYVMHVQTAEDVVQEAFIKLWRKPDAFDTDHGTQFTTWFTRVVTNTALDTIRKRKPESDAGLDIITDKGPTQSEKMIVDHDQQQLERAIQSLPERQKVALNMCFYDNMSNKDAADVLGIGVKALESLLMRGKAKLRDQLIRDGVMEESYAG